MAITEKDLQPGLVVVNHDLEVVRQTAQPLDQKILGGIALSGRLQPGDLDTVASRLNDEFDQLRSDKSNEYCACIAYAIDLPAEDEPFLDQTLIGTAVRQNHGMLSLSLEAKHLLWQGHDKDKEFLLRKYMGAILLNNGRYPRGLIYSLAGGPKTQVN